MAQRYEITFDLRDEVRLGEDGVTFFPEVSEEGIISWTNNGGLPNPEPRNIKGPQGEKGDRGDVYIHIIENAQGGETITITSNE